MTYEYVHSMRRVPCWGCEKLTQRVSVDWGVHICSAECEAIVDKRVGRELDQQASDPDRILSVADALEATKPKPLMDQLLAERGKKKGED